MNNEEVVLPNGLKAGDKCVRRGVSRYYLATIVKVSQLECLIREEGRKDFWVDSENLFTLERYEEWLDENIHTFETEKEKLKSWRSTNNG